MKLMEIRTHRLFGRWKVWTVEVREEPHEFAPLSMGHQGIGPSDDELALKRREIEALEASVIAHGGKLPVRVDEEELEEAAGLGALFG